MNLTQLKYFLAVCNYQSLSKAAEYLYISQPSLSSAIRELEQSYGVKLFRRHHRGMILTPEGEVLQKNGKELLKNAEQLDRVMHDYGNDRKVLRLGVPPMIGSLLLPFIYREFLSENPDIQIEINEGGRQELLSMLSSGLLDMVFLAHNIPLTRDLSVLDIAKLEIVCCASKNHPVANFSSVCASDLLDVPLVLFKNSFFQTEEIKKWFASQGVVPNVLLQTEQLSTLRSIIKNDTAVGFLFRELIQNDTDLVPVSLSEPMLSDISLVWQKDGCMLSSMQRLLDYVSLKNPFRHFQGK